MSVVESWAVVGLSIALLIVGAVALSRLGSKPRERDPTELDAWADAEADQDLWRLRAALGDDGDVRHG